MGKLHVCLLFRTQTVSGTILVNAYNFKDISPFRYVGEGARMVREIFEMARTKKACLIFFDEIDAVGGETSCFIFSNDLFFQRFNVLHYYFIWNVLVDGIWRPTTPGARFDDGAGGDNEVQRTMLELINQLDGFDPRGSVMALLESEILEPPRCSECQEYRMLTNQT